ncbi:MAG: sulfite exporter TauE/SafE family protein [Desulfobacterales bacterium]|nr:sulfite exporter TauE/SafE family protein [Deltaproteobacteria bacterium]NNK94985.1 sulfite exporter TauE/SafE family protein [Desulfobacterales bacterium]
MEIETLLFAAIQSSFLLGLLHGVNPCGHSWLVLAPFVTGERNGNRVALLTIAFISGTALACLVLGATLGAISQFIPDSMGMWVEAGTSILLIILGVLLIYNPHLLHHHGDACDHSHCSDNNHHQHKHGHSDCTTHSLSTAEEETVSRLQTMLKNKKMLPFALFGIGFINMIIPCPTAAVMYGYALNATNTFTATLVFGTYALSTAIAVGGVIFIIFKATSTASSMQKDWIEPLIMRTAGGIIVIFSTYGLYLTFTN